MITADLLADNLSNVKGHKLAKDLLIKSITLGNTAVYLLVGPPHVGKGLIARSLAAGIHGLDNIDTPHPDTIFFNEILKTNEISSSKVEQKKWKESVDDFIRFINLSPAISNFKVAVIEDIDRLSLSATNALLKTLEEPPARSIIIVTAQSINAVLPTIKSRAQIIRFNHISDDDMQKYVSGHSSSYVDEIVLISNGSIEVAKKLLDDQEFLQQKIDQLESLKVFLQGNVVKGLALANLSNRDIALDLINNWIIAVHKLLINTKNDKYSKLFGNLYGQDELVWLIDQFNDLIKSLKSGANIKIALEASVLGWAWRQSK